MDAVLPVVRLGKFAAGTGAGWLRPDDWGCALRCLLVSMARAGSGDGLIIRARGLQGVGVVRS
jgi:hypothetical protein